MKKAHRDKVVRRRGKTVRFHRIAGCACFLLCLIVLLGWAGFRVNVTPSQPLGLWRIVEPDRPVAAGDLVFICPPQTDAMRQARLRGYLRFGLCPSYVAPLIKTVAATSGQMIEAGRHVHVDGKPLAHSQVALEDGQGREMTPYGGGAVPEGTVYLHSEFPGSFDSRYFGPLPSGGILGLARKVWTYGP